MGVAVSGGGDSLALLHALALWGRRPLEVFCVDHRINPASASWTARVAETAAHLGAGFTPLSWDAHKPANGLAAAARTARHRLLARAARTKGCRVLCLGHTGDDVLEAAAMRAAGSNVSAPQLWSPSPVWPEGRGQFLFRPLLTVRRAALRDWLAAAGLDWIDDPANDNPVSLRARMRQDIAAGGRVSLQDRLALARDRLPDDLLLAEAGAGDLGLLRFDAAVFDDLPRDVAARWLAVAAVCAGGGDRLPRRQQAESVLERIVKSAETLCGARLWRDDGMICIVREAGEMRRHPIAPYKEDDELVWDGRFALRGVDAVLPSSEARARLNEADQRRLRQWPAALRGVLPVVKMDAGGDDRGLLLATPGLAGAYSYRCQGLVRSRFLAAAGVVASERDL